PQRATDTGQRRIQGLPLPLLSMAEAALYEMHGSGMEAAEGGRMHQLCKQQHQKMIGQRSQQYPAQRRQQKACYQHQAQGETLEQRRHHQKQQHLGNDPQPPEQADDAPLVTEHFQMDAEKGVVRTVTHLHQADTDIKGQYPRAAQLSQETTLPGRFRALLRLGIGHPDAAEDDTRHNHHDRYRINIQTDSFEQRAQPHHRYDKANAAPQTNLAIVRGLFAQMRQSDHLELRQYRMPEERMQSHHQYQPGVTFIEEDQAERQQCAKRADTYDGQTLSGRVAQPAPQIRSQAAHQHGNRHQLADALCGKAQLGEIQAEKRRRRTKQREVKEIEAGKAPVGKRNTHTQRASSHEQRQSAVHMQLEARGLQIKADPVPASLPAHPHSGRDDAGDDPAARWPSSPRQWGWRGARLRGHGGLWG